VERAERMMFARIAPPAGTHRLGAAQAKPPIPLRLGRCHAPQLARVQERSGPRADAMEIFLHASVHDPSCCMLRICCRLPKTRPEPAAREPEPRYLPSTGSHQLLGTASGLALLSPCCQSAPGTCRRDGREAMTWVGPRGPEPPASCLSGCFGSSRGAAARPSLCWRPRDNLFVYSGGSVACSSRMVISAVFGDGKPTEVSTSSNSPLAQRVRTRSSDSHTPMMYSARSPIAQ